MSRDSPTLLEIGEELWKRQFTTTQCRTRVFENRFGEKTSISRGNVSFTTINIVGLALECREIENKQNRIYEFFKLLDRYLDVSARQLIERYEFQSTATARQFPLLMSKLWLDSEKLKPNDSVAPVLKHGTLGIGFIGLAECLVALIGKHHGENAEAQELGLKIITHMRDAVKAYADKYDKNFSLLATPAESLSGKFTKIDKKKYGIIKGVTDRNYYTNSSHVPVYHKCTMQQKAMIEAPYHDLERGGHIFYIELDGDATHNPESIETVVNLMDKHNMGYGSVNHTRSRCIDCGFENADGDIEECPQCGSINVDIIQRITGYLVGGVGSWNAAKQDELKDRVKHN